MRLAQAGFRRFFQPAFTAREIFHATSDEVLPLVHELGVATGLIALLSFWQASFVLPSAIYAAIFYGTVGVIHVSDPNRCRNENIAMASAPAHFTALKMAFGKSTLEGEHETRRA